MKKSFISNEMFEERQNLRLYYDGVNLRMVLMKEAFVAQAYELTPCRTYNNAFHHKTF